MKAVYWYQRAISKDDHPRAHFKLAFYYVQGITASFGEKRLLSPDLVIAARHFRKSAQANDPDAMIELGQLLLSRHNQDNALFEPELQEEGILWLETAVEQGSRDACRELGNLYHSGRESSETNNTGFFPVYPICQDFEKSFDYFNSAANLDDKTSALFLGSYYEHGICVPPNINLAKSWYSAAMKQYLLIILWDGGRHNFVLHVYYTSQMRHAKKLILYLWPCTSTSQSSTCLTLSLY
jgi:TPR repeat protein